MKSTTKKRILKTSLKLFAKHGYEKTSVRQILKEAGASTGSMYFFFKNKSEILKTIYETFLKKLGVASTSAFKNKDVDIYTKYTLYLRVLVYYLMNFDDFARVFISSHSLPEVEEMVIKVRKDRLKELFSDVSDKYDDDFYSLVIIASQGVILSVLESKITKNLPKDEEKVTDFMLKIALAMFDLHPDKIKECIISSKKLFDETDISFKTLTI